MNFGSGGENILAYYFTYMSLTGLGNINYLLK